MTFLNHAADQRFIESEHRSMLLIDEHPDALLDKFAIYQPPAVDKAKWVLQMASFIKGDSRRIKSQLYTK